MCKFLVVGDVTVDQMYFVETLPDQGGERTALRAVMEPGGAGGTIATVLARLSTPVTIATRVGLGPFSDLALSNVRESGVETQLIQNDTHLQTSSVTLLITPDTQRTMISASGASRNLDSAELSYEIVAEYDALVMSAYSLVSGRQREYAVQSLGHARKAGLTTFVDMGSGAMNALEGRVVSLIGEIDYLIMNETELYALTGETSISEAVSGLRKEGIERLVVKVGEMGSIVITPEITELVEALNIDDVIDSTGAGDYFTAAFAYGIMKGHDLLYSARLGNVAGGLSTTVVGAQTYRLDKGALENLTNDLESG
ncbi:MAG: sugar kinase [Trueperaceae bacterium]|nr:sugar kinase [Trueperaceae bacterium]|tara:strand:+ start:173 stop:1111 length:939 start_codon:yes stop_codon:yes gene_type:complete